MPNLRNITEVQEISSLSGEEKVLLNVNGEAMQARADLIKPDVKTFPVVDVINEGDKVLLNVNGEQKQADASLIKPKNLVGKMTESGGEIFNSYSDNIASGANSHAEGIRTLAYGAQSHAEGFGSPDKITGVINVVSCEIVGTGKNQHTDIVISVPEADCITESFDDGTEEEEYSLIESFDSRMNSPKAIVQKIIGFKFGNTKSRFDSNTIFKYDSSIVNVYSLSEVDDGPRTPADAPRSVDSTPEVLDVDVNKKIRIQIVECASIPTGNVNITLISQGAIGTTSHAEGGRTIAAGQASHAEGMGTRVLYKTKSGDPIGAHAEGTNTIAMGKGAHAEGGGTTASGKYAHAEGDGCVASGLGSHAEGYYTTASGDYGSHAEGYYTTASSGRDSHAEGYYTTASGNISHAEGDSTTASGSSSHAEGYYTTASGNSSHAEGYSTTASGGDSHAEGYNTTASGGDSHAEGYNTTASGEDSHAEGYSTTASGGDSHAEGSYTTASGDHQHVQGRYNIDDPSSKYAHIVGNGTSSSARSNAHTLDWDGNAWYAGDVEGKSMIVKSSTPGSVKRFRITVDDTGNIKAEEIIDIDTDE